MTINNIPSSTQEGFSYKGVNSSHVHNEIQEKLCKDILNLFNKANLLEKKVNENFEYMLEDTQNVESINLLLINKYNDLLDRYYKILSNKKDRSNIIYPSECNIESNITGAVIDKLYNTITIRPSKKISKLTIVDDITDTSYIPDSLRVNSFTKCNGFISEDESDIMAPFMYNDNFYYTKRVVTDDTCEEVVMEYIITLPEAIMTTINTNQMLISPYNCNLIDAYYRYGDSATWDRINSVDFNSSIAVKKDEFIHSARKCSLSFEDIKANQIKLIFKCSSYRNTNTNTRVFSFGIKEIGIYVNYFNNYQTNSFYFDTEIKEDCLIVITGIETIFNNCETNGKYEGDVIYELYYKDSENINHRILDKFPFTPPTNKLRVKCVIGEKYKNMNISRIKLNYSLLTE